jgi:Putative metallopeptidase
MRGFLKAILFALVFYFPFAQSVSAQVAEHLGPLANSVKEGRDGAWEARIQDGWFNLLNDTEKGAVQYYYASLAPIGKGERVVKLTTVLRASGSDPAYAGIILDWISETEYFGFAVGSDGSVTVIRRDADGFKFTPADGVAARLDGSDVLELRETATSIALIANGEEIFTIDGPNGFAPAYGIIAVGTGRFAYTGFTITDTAPQTPFPSPGGPAAPTGGEAPFPAPKTGDATPPGDQPPPIPGAPAPAPDGGDTTQASPQEIYLGKVLMGTTMGVFFHEFAHALIGETGLPATGPEEDTADGFSALLMAAMVEDGDVANEQERDFLQGMTEYASLLWYYSGQMSAQVAPQPGDWQGEHAPDLKRFRNSFCLIYGSNPARYEAVATKVGLEPRTKERCKQEFESRSTAWETILMTVARNLGEDIPGKLPADAPGGKILLSFQPSKLREGQAVQQLLDGTGVMKEVLDFLAKAFVFPRDVRVEFRDCDDVNAWYDPQNSSITMCYSLIQATTQLVLKAEAQPATTPVAQPGTPQQPGPPPVPSGGQSGDPAAFLVGDWQTTLQGQGQTYTAIVRYAPNGRYESVTESPYGVLRVSGTWTAQKAGPNAITLNASPTDWSPKQLCDNNGQCQANQQAPFSVQVQVVDQNTVTADGASWTRTQ